MSTYRDRGIVLRVKTLRDADRHYIVFTEKHGKVALLAKGARKGRSKMSPHLSGFGTADIMVAAGRVIDRLAGASLDRPFRGIAASLEKNAAAQSFLLAVDALTKTELPEERIFSLLISFLDALDSPHLRLSASPSLFDAGIVKLMDILGVAPEIRACVACRGRLTSSGNALHLIRGGIACGACADESALPVSVDAIKSLRYYRDASFPAIPMLRLPDGPRREVASLVELFLASHLEGRFAGLRFLKTMSRF